MKPIAKCAGCPSPGRLGPRARCTMCPRKAGPLSKCARLTDGVQTESSCPECPARIHPVACLCHVYVPPQAPGNPSPPHSIPHLCQASDLRGKHSRQRPFSSTPASWRWCWQQWFCRCPAGLHAWNREARYRGVSRKPRDSPEQERRAERTRKGNGAEMGKLSVGRCVDKRYEESGTVRDRKARHRSEGWDRGSGKDTTKGQ